MNKNLIALAVGATIAAAPIVATQADVKLFGKIQVELVNLDGAEFDKLNEMGDANGMSRFGVDGSKDLGNGLKAIGRYAFKLNASNGQQFSARDQWVGLKGGFGAIILGRQPSPYKMNGGVKWDPYVATFMQARAAGGMAGGALGQESFVNDVIAYASPKFAGIKFQVGYVADENSAGGKGGANGSVLAGATGSWGPIDVIVGYNNYRNRAIDSLDIGGGDDVKQTKIGVRYKGNGLTAALQFEDVDSIGNIKVNGHNITPDGQTGGKITFANLGYKFGNTLIAGNYGTTDSDTGTDVDYYAIGARYFFAKKVSAYIGWAETKTDNSYKLIGTGLRYDF